MNKTSPYIPDIFVIGAGKCGTTSINELFKKIPEIVCYPKEINFFSDEKKYQMGDKFLKSKLNFNSKNINSLICDVSPQYSDTFSKDTAKRIFNNNPNAKIIYIIRNPLERMKSIWRHRLPKEDKKSYDFNEIILNSSHIHHRAYMYESKYYCHLSNYKKFFPDKNIFVIHFEDLIKKKSKVFLQLSIFLGFKLLTKNLPHYNLSRPSFVASLVLPVQVKSKHLRIAKRIKSFLRPMINFLLLKNLLQYSREIPVVHPLVIQKIDKVVMQDYKKICQYIKDQTKRFS